LKMMNNMCRAFHPCTSGGTQPSCDLWAHRPHHPRELQVFPPFPPRRSPAAASQRSVAARATATPHRRSREREREREGWGTTRRGGTISRRRPIRSSRAGASSATSTRMPPTSSTRPASSSSSPRTGEERLPYTKGLQGDSKHEAASAYVEAANCYKKFSPQDAAQALNNAVNLFLEIGRLNMAARYSKDIGEIYQQEQDLENAAVYLSRAADLFDSEGQSSQANSMTQKIAEIYAQLEK